MLFTKSPQPKRKIKEPKERRNQPFYFPSQPFYCERGSQKPRILGTLSPFICFPKYELHIMTSTPTKPSHPLVCYKNSGPDGNKSLLPSPFNSRLSPSLRLSTFGPSSCNSGKIFTLFPVIDIANLVPSDSTMRYVASSFYNNLINKYVVSPDLLHGKLIKLNAT